MEEVILKLAGETTEPYAKEALLELAAEFHNRAVALQREEVLPGMWLEFALRDLQRLKAI
jgi:hypothetical protein